MNPRVVDASDYSTLSYLAEMLRHLHEGHANTSDVLDVFHLLTPTARPIGAEMLRARGVPVPGPASTSAPDRQLRAVGIGLLVLAGLAALAPSRKPKRRRTRKKTAPSS